MSLQLFTLSSFLHLLCFLFVILVEIQLSLSHPCLFDFVCGDVRAKYPFWGENRPEFCGHPALKLYCKEDGITATTMMDMMGVKYRVLYFNDRSKVLKIVRDDYLGGICPPDNLKTPIDSAVLNYSSTGYENLKLSFSCILVGDEICDGVIYKDGFINKTDEHPPCNGYNSVTVLVPKDSLEEAKKNLSTLEQVLKQGFEVKWTLDITCSTCMKSDDICGYNISKLPVCYCSYRQSPHPGCIPFPLPPKPVHPPDPHPPEAEKKNENHEKNKLRPAKVASIAVASAAFVCLLFCVFILVQRRRNAAKTKSKDLLALPSSTTTTSSSFGLSQSIPSYPFSKSDLTRGSNYFGAQVFSYTELEEATDNFDSSKELGDGGFGTVYYGVLKDGREVAVKRLYENNFRRVEQFKNEIEILNRLQHPNLVALYGCTSRHSRELILVYEYIPNGTVADHIHGGQSNSRLLTWPIRLNIAVETADALVYLHANDVIHRDVKTNNILLDNNFHVKVADFGLSRLFPNNVTHVSTAPQGTPGYVDPEYYQCYHLTEKSDVYSFGVVLIELISSLQAVDTNRHRQDINLASMAVNRIQNHALNELIDPSLGFEIDYAVRNMVTSVAELAFRCLQHDREMRPAMQEVLEVLKEIQSQQFGALKAEVVDICTTDDVVLLKSIPPPVSPDSAGTDKWMKIRTL